MLTQEMLEAKALDDYATVRSHVMQSKEVTGYAHDDSIECFCEPPALVRIVDTSERDILHWNDTWLDPHWNVELVEPHPDLDGLTSLWVYGKSYSLDGQERL